MSKVAEHYKDPGAIDRVLAFLSIASSEHVVDNDFKRALVLHVVDALNEVHRCIDVAKLRLDTCADYLTITAYVTLL